MRPERLCIEGKTFEGFRRDLNAVLDIAVNKMLEIGVPVGVITGRIRIEIERDSENGKTVAYPKFKFDTDMNLPIRGKVESEGDIDLKIAYGNDGFMIGSQSLSLFDLLESEEE